ncbi:MULTISPECIES: glucokinase [unclassified Cobetia]|uniref:glucokinase n=1 Tax=unclassified Cobetia TaxID=2609414 RepID=UPI0020969B18|nr:MULTISPECIES: glucokinase [unclassified Cobetia]MCO7231304.1 glucokinase [Cobetia sp. Dlab-2-AX]MCO7234287.1 glucokinase [Cobetia sp. Dlab-2-U]
MTRDTSHRLALVGDIGGTNARLALVQPGSHTLQHIQTLACAEHAGLEEAIQAYYRMLGLSEAEQPVEACLAFACPVHDERVSMTNNHWTFLKREVRDSLGLERFKCLNDFTAMALGVPHIEASERLAIGEELTEGSGDAASPRLVIGPGTGLGVAGLVRGTHNWIPLATEGGHASFAPTDEIEDGLLGIFRRRHGRVSVERLLCGQGMLEIYQALGELRGMATPLDSAASVSQAAHAAAVQDEASIRSESLALEAVMRFMKILGAVAGDAALTLGARGGVYLCGGVLPRNLDLLMRSDFRHAFTDKNRLSRYNAAIPTWVVTAPWTGLLGAAEALHNEEVT